MPMLPPVKFDRPFTFTVVIPCYNEEATLADCVDKVLQIQDETLALEIIIVDDCSRDRSLEIARDLAARHDVIRVLHHEVNQGKGAALRTGFQHATGEFVGIQDADLEYNVMELRNLLVPLVNDDADVVLGSRYLARGAHRVLYFWHSLMNKGLTFISNMFTDLDLTDMETCYKVFKREVIQAVDIEENRFGFEPEIVAKVAQMRVRVHEMAISYSPRTYEEGKKIGWRDGVRALYCIFHYSSHAAPLPVQFLIYLFIGGASFLVNLLAFSVFLSMNVGLAGSAAMAYLAAAVVNYFLCIALLFRHKARFDTAGEILVYLGVTVFSGLLDVFFTAQIAKLGDPIAAKAAASILVLVVNFLARKFIVFYEPPLPPWKAGRRQ